MFRSKLLAAPLALLLLQDACAPTVTSVASSAQGSPSTDRFYIQNGGMTGRWETNISVIQTSPNFAHLSERRFYAMVDLGYRRAQVRGRSEETFDSAGINWTIKDHYLYCWNGSTCEGPIAWLRAELGFESPYWWQPYHDGRIMQWTHLVHHVVGCAEPVSGNSCSTADQFSLQVTCSATAGQCYFTAPPPGATAMNETRVAANQDMVESEVIVESGPPATLGAPPDDAELAAPFDWAADPWADGDIALARRTFRRLRADAWDADGRINPERLAEYGFRLDPVDWIVPL